MADIPFAFIRDMMAAALGVEAHLLRPPYKDAQEFDYRLSRILRADFDYKDIFSASAMHGLEEGTVYYVHNTLELNYVFMPVPILRHRTRGGRAHDGCGGTRRGMPAVRRARPRPRGAPHAGFHRDGPGAAGRGVPVFHGASGAALPR